LKRRYRILVLTVLCLTATAASAQNFPSRSARIVAGFAAGGATDVTARIRSDVIKDLHAPELKSRMLGQGIGQSTLITPEKHAAFGKGECARWGKALKDIGIR